MMSTNNENNKEVTKVENTQAVENTQVAETQQQVPAQPEEKKEGFIKKAWNKAKRPIAIGAAVLGAFGLGIATDHFVINKTDSNQDEQAAGCNSATEDSTQS